MFKFKLIDRKSYNDLINLCSKVLAKNDELLLMAEKILQNNKNLLEFNKNLLELNGFKVKGENNNAEN